MDMQKIFNAIMDAETFRRSSEMGQITLGALIDALALAPPDAVVETEKGHALGSPHSYRGYYDQIAFQVERGPVTAGALLEVAKSAIGQVFEGYKGGDYPAHRGRLLNVANYGTTGVPIVGIEARDGKIIVKTGERE